MHNYPNFPVFHGQTSVMLTQIATGEPTKMCMNLPEVGPSGWFCRSRLSRFSCTIVIFELDKLAIGTLQR